MTILSGNRRRDAGVTDGWIQRGYLRHLCWPPNTYPAGWGPGTTWECQTLIRTAGGATTQCGKRWRSLGIRLVNDYPDPESTNTAILGPWRWMSEDVQSPSGTHRTTWLSENGYPELAEEEDLYDHRGLPAYHAKLLRLILDTMSISSEEAAALADWRRAT